LFNFTAQASPQYTVKLAHRLPMEVLPRNKGELILNEARLPLALASPSNKQSLKWALYYVDS
jgi:hypothetical protein